MELGLTRYEFDNGCNMILFLDKPAGITSHDVVDRVRQLYQTRRVGHAGTLDPFATGLLIVGVGSATKTLASYVGLEKTYIATARLGVTSTTDDLEGVVTEIVSKDVQHRIPLCHDIDRALDAFRGSYLQAAPIYSAKKVGGKKLYELARRGLAHTVPQPTKRVTIFDLRTLTYKWPEFTFTVTCSSGTYIRALARDIGQTLGTGAYLTALRRTRIGVYSVENAQKITSPCQLM